MSSRSGGVMGVAEMHARIPHARIAVLIGPKGSAKREVERETGTTIDVESGTGEVTVSGDDAISVMTTCEYVRAVGRGFSPERAKRLFSEGTHLMIVDIRKVVGRSRNRVRIMRGRLIGRRGRVRRMLEDMSGAYISVMGNTVAVIGDVGEVETVRVAIEMLLHGAEHHSVFAYLERKRDETLVAGSGGLE